MLAASESSAILAHPLHAWFRPSHLFDMTMPSRECQVEEIHIVNTDLWCGLYHGNVTIASVRWQLPMG